MPLTRIRLNTRQLAGLICLAVFPNGFRGTTLPKRLDLSNKVTLIGDACATRAQTYAGESVRRVRCTPPSSLP
jgi:hypothetical protein